MTRVAGIGVSCRGFSLLELMVAMAITLLVVSAVFAMLDPAAGAFQTQPEAADMQQRLRVSADAIYRDLLTAGSLPSTATGARISAIPAASTFPMRIGRRTPDAPQTFSGSRVAFWSVSPTAPQTELASPLASASGSAAIAAGPGCPEGDSSCGFRTGTTVAVIGAAGAWDLFSISAVQGNTLTLQHNLQDSALTYPAADTTIAEVTARTYFFRDDSTAGIGQLMRYDGGSGADVPVVEHVAGLSFEYFGDAEPPAMVVSVDAGAQPRVTYGPKPPEPGVQPTSYPPGENCVFARSSGGMVTSRLPQLAAGPALVPLTATMLTDGPWCPDGSSPNRYDADLLRVREIAVTITIEAAVSALRGPAGPLFTRAGTARGTRLVPDRIVRLVIAPRALNLGR